MFDMIKNLTKAAVAVAVTPATLAIDIAASPFETLNGNPGHRTIKKIKQAGNLIDEAIKPEAGDRHVG